MLEPLLEPDVPLVGREDVADQIALLLDVGGGTADEDVEVVRVLAIRSEKARLLGAEKLVDVDRHLT